MESIRKAGTLRKVIGPKIKEFRKKLRPKMSQERLAEIVGVEKNTVYRWEANLSYPEPEHIDAIAQALNVPVSDLMETNRFSVKMDLEFTPLELRDMFLRTARKLNEAEKELAKLKSNSTERTPTTAALLKSLNELQKENVLQVEKHKSLPPDFMRLWNLAPEAVQIVCFKFLKVVAGELGLDKLGRSVDKDVALLHELSVLRKRA